MLFLRRSWDIYESEGTYHCPGTAGQHCGGIGIGRGDVLLSVGGQRVQDIFDYRYLTNEEYLEICVRKADGEEWELEIEKDYEEDLGIEFENGLMDSPLVC